MLGCVEMRACSVDRLLSAELWIPCAARYGSLLEGWLRKFAGSFMIGYVSEIVFRNTAESMYSI